MTLALIATVAANGVIGTEDDVPWDRPAAREYYKQTTKAHPLLLGRYTYENCARTVGGPLPSRKTVVLSRNPDYKAPDATAVYQSIPRALTALQSLAPSSTAYIGGGKSVFEQTIAYASRLVLITIDRVHTGTTYFPPLDENAWTTTEQQSLAPDLTVISYERPTSPKTSAQF